MSAAPAWPTPQDYNLAIQNPRQNLKDPELQTGMVATGKLGLPAVVSGAFASVYRITSGGHDWAVRCFDNNRPEMRERYDTIGEHLRHSKLPYTVPFEYLAQGIKVNGSWYPIVKMAWLQGSQLDAYIGGCLGEPAKLRRLAANWLKMARALEASGIVHGDLQHGNVIVVGDELRLVDYDGMAVPKLHVRVASELGHRNYQHPGRAARHVGLGLDRFSAWVVYVSLLAVAAQPDLWRALNAGDDCLLFRRADFEDPASSRAFAALAESPDPAVRASTAQLRRALALAPMQTPLLQDGLSRTPDAGRQTQADIGAVGWLAVPYLLGRPAGISVAVARAEVAPRRHGHRGPSYSDGDASVSSAWYREYVPHAVPRKRFAHSPTPTRVALLLSLLALMASVSLALPVVALLPIPVIWIILVALVVGDVAILIAAYVRDPAVVAKRSLRTRRGREVRRDRETGHRVRRLERKLTLARNKGERRRERLAARALKVQTAERAERQAVEAELRERQDVLDRALRDLDTQLRDELAAALSASWPLTETLREAIVARHVAERKRLAEERARQVERAKNRQRGVEDRYEKGRVRAEKRLADAEQWLQEQRSLFEGPIADLRRDQRQARDAATRLGLELERYEEITPQRYARFIVRV